MNGCLLITYCGEGSHRYSALLCTDLSYRFGEDLVFLVSGAGEELMPQVRSARAVLAVIGPNWLTVADATGERAINDPGGRIRRELAAAFAMRARVIPVLIDGAVLPMAADLPEDIEPLSRCQVRHLRQRDLIGDLDRLAEDLTTSDRELQAVAGSRRLGEVFNRVEGTVHGHVVQANIINGNVNFTQEARSAYDHQIARIAPAALLDRDTELAELAAWCAEPAGSYLWWQAPAWSGKTALLSWFALHPPADVDVVSFFITARLAGQADRVAFAEVVLEQCAALMGEALPALLTEATREGHMLDALARAAVASEQRGRRLVLVVDGLDEDRGATADTAAHSIAAILPSEGPRVVVSSRPEPPIPPDVSRSHPLRRLTPRSLSRSRHAEVVQVDAHRELVRLVHGNAVECDLLGFVTVAGGVSASDLSELCAVDRWVIDDHLGAVSARSFTRQAPDLDGQAGYLLGHEELQREAELLLGPRRMADYRVRTHEWAAGYLALGWPSDTPGFLVTDYFRLLCDAGEDSLVVRYATDQRRHALLRSRSGGHGAALLEVDAAWRVLVSHPASDWLQRARLAIREADLRGGLTPLNADLAKTWALLGQVSRAETAARSLTSPTARARVLCSLVHIVPDSIRATALSNEAERLVRAELGHPERAELFAQLAWGAASRGDHVRAQALADEAEGLTRSTSDRSIYVPALANLAGAASAAGERARSGRLADETVSFLRGASRLPIISGDLANLALVLFRAGHVEQARAALDEARRDTFDLFCNAFDRQGQPESAAMHFLKAIPALVRATVALEDPAGALEFDDHVASVAAHVNVDLDLYHLAQAALICARAAAGQFERAITDARCLPGRAAEALSELAALAAANGDPDRARMLATEAEDLLTVNSRGRRDLTIRQALATATARSGVSCAPASADLSAPQYELAPIAATRNTSPLGERERTDLVEAAASAGDIDRAIDLALPLADRHRRAEALVILVGTLSRTGDVCRAETLIPLIDSDYRRVEATIALVQGAASNGAVDAAEAAVESLADANDQARALCAWARTAIDSGDLTQASLLIARAERAAGSGIATPGALAKVTNTLLALGDLDRAEEVARLIGVSAPHRRDPALAEVAQAIATTGDVARARAVVRACALPRSRATALADLARDQMTAGHAAWAEDLVAEAVEVITVSRSGVRQPAAFDPALRTLVDLLVCAGKPARADAVADLIVEDEARGNALVHIAGHLGADDAVRRLHDAFSWRHWSLIMTLLSIVEPDTIAVLASEFLP